MQTQFTTIRRAAILDQLCEAKDRAVEAAAGNARWLNAIDAAWGWLLDQDVLSYDASTHALQVTSASEPGRSYTANGACQCRAFELHNACWHRAAARLVRRAVELAEQAQASAEAAEIAELAAELLAEAQAAGCAWYGQREAEAGARLRMRELEDYAAAWDAQAGALRAQALGARIVAARRQLAVAA